MTNSTPVELIRFPFFTTQITTLDLGKAFIKQLVSNEISFHLEDPTNEIIKHEPGKSPTRLFTDQESIYLTQRVKELYSLDWEEYNCPIDYLLKRLNQEEGEQTQSPAHSAPPMIEFDYSPGLTVQIRSFDVLKRLSDILSISNISSEPGLVIIESTALTDESIRVAVCELLDVSITGDFIFAALGSEFIHFKHSLNEY